MPFDLFSMQEEDIKEKKTQKKVSAAKVQLHIK